MRECEVRAVVDDLAACRQRVVAAGAQTVFVGRLEDRRYDTGDGALSKQDVALRIRTYRNASYASGSLDWKGPTSVEDGFKIREELTTSVGDPETLANMLKNVGYGITREIDRDILQYDLNGTMIRFEQYPRMDTLVEVEGDPEGIEAAIAVIGIPRDRFTADALSVFIKAYEARTGTRAATSIAELEQNVPPSNGTGA